MSDQNFYSLLTMRGLEKQAVSITDNAPINLTHIALGEGDYAPTGYEQELQNEKYRTTLTRVALDTIDKNKVIVEAIISGEVGGFWIREVGIFDNSGELFAIGKYPPIFKPVITDGAVKDICVRMVLKFTNASNVQLIYNGGMGGSGTTAGTFLAFTDYGHLIEAVPFSTEERPNFEYDFAAGDYTYDYGTLQE